MAIRTTATAVKDILAPGKDYDSIDEPKLTPFIRAANLTTNRVATCATAKGIPLSSDELLEIETWMACYYYTRSDPIYQSRSTKGKSGQFVADPNDPERYRAGAIALDPSGCLKSILMGNRAGASWLGKAPSEQIDYVDRD